MPDRKVFKDYEQSDVDAAFEHGQPSCWHDLINFLERQIHEPAFLTPGESAHMIADAKQVMKDNAPFTYHPETAFRVMRSHRNPELVRQEEQRWAQKSVEWNKSTAREYRRAS